MIAIIAVLATVVILTLNPAELLRKSHDANRLSDLATLQQALTIYAEDQGGFPLASSGVTYLSVPDPTATTTAGTDCSGLGGYFTGGGSFHCPASSTYRNVDGTGWIPVNFKAASFGSPLGTLPVDPVNTTSSGEYYAFETNGSTFKLTATPESQTYLAQAGKNPSMFQVGNNLALDGGQYWVPVAGNSTFGTGNFWVMKYDAKCFSGTTPLTAPAYGSYGTYNNSSQPCTGSYAVGSAPDGYPIANIDQTDAASYCAAIGAHLITNNEWQTIAWNAENVASNWSGGSVGSGYIYSGHNDNAPASALEASSDDADGYYGETNTGGNQRRTLTLSDGAVVWDIAGNVFQWTNDMIAGQNEPYGGTPGFTYREFTAITSWGTMSQQTAGPLNSAWNSSQGIGQIYSDGTATNTTVYGFLRGGNWASGATVGVEMLSLNDIPSHMGSDVGFRCAR